MSTQGWPSAPIQDIAAVTAGNPAPQGAEHFEGGTRPFVRVQDLGRLSGAAHVIDTADHVNERAASSLKLFPKGSVLFTKSGASLLLNQRAILSRDMHVVSHIGVAIPGPRVTSEWLYYWLRTVNFADLAHGANMPSLQLSRVKQIQIPLPSLDEQRTRVAELEKQFSRLNEAVANLKRVKANAKRYRASILKAAIEGRLGQSVAHRGAAAVPRGWKQEAIRDVLEIIDYRGRTPPFADSGIPHLRSSNIRDGKIVWSDLAYITEETYKAFMTRGIPREGDVLFTTEAPMGEVALVPGTRFSVAQRIMILRADPTVLLSRFLMIQLSSPQFRARLRHSGTGSTVTGVSSRNFQPLKLLLPPLEQQERIVDEVARGISEIEALNALVADSLQRAVHLREKTLDSTFSAT